MRKTTLFASIFAIALLTGIGLSLFVAPSAQADTCVLFPDGGYVVVWLDECCSQLGYKQALECHGTLDIAGDPCDCEPVCILHTDCGWEGPQRPPKPSN